MIAHRLAGHWVTVVCEAPELVADLRRLYPAIRRAASPSDAVPSVRVAREPAGYRIGTPKGAATCGDAAAACEAVEWAVAEALLQATADRVHLHAGGAVVGDAALLVLGRGGAGKSSITFAWHRTGLPVLGDDVVLVERDGRASPFPRLFKLHPGVLEGAGIPPASTPCWRHGAAEAWYDPGPEGWASSSVRVGLVAVARRTGGSTPRLRDLPASAGLAALLESALPSGRAGAAAFAALHAVAGGGRAVEIEFADSARAAATLRALLP
jgi:hypothetical protein